jgi:hypothetical protein
VLNNLPTSGQANIYYSGPNIAVCLAEKGIIYRCGINLKGVPFARTDLKGK